MADVGSGFLTAGMAYLRGDKEAVMRGLMDMGKKIVSRKNVDRETKEKKASEADCIMFSGYVPTPLYRATYHATSWLAHVFFCCFFGSLEKNCVNAVSP